MVCGFVKRSLPGNAACKLSLPGLQAGLVNWAILLFLTAYPLFLSAQTSKIDSLVSALRTGKDDTGKVNGLNDLSEKLRRIGQYDTSMSVAGNALALAEKLEFKKGIAKAYRSIGLVSYNQADYPKALECFFKAMKIAEETGNKPLQASITSNIGIVYRNQGDYPRALEYDFKSLKMAEEIGNKHLQSNATGNIGSVYYNEGDFHNALEYYFKDLKMDEDMGNKDDVASDLNNIGNVYTDEHDFSRALEYFFRALKMAEASEDVQLQANATGNIGAVYSNQYNYSMSLEYYFKALKLDEEMGDKSGIAINMCNMGVVYTRQKNYKQAKLYLDSTLALSINIGENGSIKDAYKGLAGYDSVTGDYKKSLEDYQKYVDYRDSLFNEASTKKSVQAAMNFDFEKKQAAEKAEQDKKDARQKIITWSIACGLVLSLLFGGFILRTLRYTRKQKNLIEQQKALVEEKNKIVEEKNREIVDSINYAKRLQDAILPPISQIKQALPESFVLYKPKDIVAGDFYWMEVASPPSKGGINTTSSEISPLGSGGAGTILIAAADCTGHGVPGALVSVVCSNALNRTVKEFKITEPGKILDKVRELVLETFEKSEDNVQDGMDISLCAITAPPPPKRGNPEQAVLNPPLEGREAGGTITVQWSGANNSLWYIQNNELKEIIPDKQPIGKYYNAKPFTTHSFTIPISPLGSGGAVLYLFTDGYADQFGGEKGKKFKYKQMQEKLLAISRQPLAEQKNILEKTFEEWKGSLEQVDDVLIIGIKV